MSPYDRIKKTNCKIYKSFELAQLFHMLYGVVPKRLLTFRGSLYKEVAKTTSETLAYRFERQTAKKKKKTSKNTESSF